MLMLNTEINKTKWQIDNTNNNSYDICIKDTEYLIAVVGQSFVNKPLWEWITN